MFIVIFLLIYPMISRMYVWKLRDDRLWLIQCSGMPECKLGLNDRVLLEAQGRATKGKAIDLEDIKFHQYVFLSLLSLNSCLWRLFITQNITILSSIKHLYINDCSKKCVEILMKVCPPCPI